MALLRESMTLASQKLQGSPQATYMSLDDSPCSNSYYPSLVQNKKIVIISSFTLESGTTLYQVPVAYSTWGTLNPTCDNVLVVCHALTGSSDVLDWWRPLMGPGKALDYTRYLIFCANVLGSPYGTASPLSTNPMTGKLYGPDFPSTTIRDDVRIHKLVLDKLGVQSVAAVIGGSMGGMHTLEWPLCTPPSFVKNIVAIATSAFQGAWGISWSETQRQAIYNDADFRQGWYTPNVEGQPRSGLGTARMIAMLTYRSFGSFENRFGRKPAAPTKYTIMMSTPPTPAPSETSSMASDTDELETRELTTLYTAQTYLHYQAEKFLKRFDANCYIHLTKKMDFHDITRDRNALGETEDAPSCTALSIVLGSVPENALVVGVQTDLLFPLEQQADLAMRLPGAKFVILDSGDGHDGFLLEFKSLNETIQKHLRSTCAWVYEETTKGVDDIEVVTVVNSVFGEAEDEIY